MPPESARLPVSIRHPLREFRASRKRVAVGSHGPDIPATFAVIGAMPGGATNQPPGRGMPNLGISVVANTSSRKQSVAKHKCVSVDRLMATHCFV